MLQASEPGGPPGSLAPRSIEFMNKGSTFFADGSISNTQVA